MVKVTNEIPTYDEPAKPSLRVHSHWNESAKVVLQFGDTSITVAADELLAAVKNATNTGRW